MKDLSKVGAYVKNTDPTMFRRICSIVNSRRLLHVGAFIEMTDPEMFDRILAHK